MSQSAQCIFDQALSHTRPSDIQRGGAVHTLAQIGLDKFRVLACIG